MTNLITLALFYNTFFIILYMFRALYVHHQEVESHWCSIWYRPLSQWLYRLRENSHDTLQPDNVYSLQLPTKRSPHLSLITLKSSTNTQKLLRAVPLNLLNHLSQMKH